MKGKVYLIGAGPGDVELLTLKAVRAVERSNVVLIDDLVIGNLAGIAAGLRCAGMADGTPVAVVQNGTLPNERRLVTQLGTVVHDVTKAGLGAPAIVVIGDVVRFAAVEGAAEAAHAWA